MLILYFILWLFMLVYVKTREKAPAPEYLPFSIGRYHTTMKPNCVSYFILFRETDSTVKKLIHCSKQKYSAKED